MLSIRQTIVFIVGIVMFYKAMFYAPIYTNEINRENETKKFNKLIYFVVDGLRYDGILKLPNSTNMYHNNINMDYAKYKHEFLSMAGIPTATTCRVFTMMTGKPSNQLDYLFTFLHIKQDGDSLIKQVLQNKHTLFHYGDEMWTELFPEIKTRSINFDPYAKENLFENERIVFNKFYDDINTIDVQIMHLISVDSMGHSTNNINSKIIQERLQIINNWIEQSYTKMDENTLMVITSDHGVTDRGEHGGCSDPELSSMCAFLTKKPIELSNNYKNGVNKNKSSIYRNMFSEKYITDGDYYKIIHQDDILGTVCVLMGYAIPNNLCGSLIKKFEHKESLKKVLKIQENIAINNNIKVDKEECEEEYSEKLSMEIRKGLFALNKPLVYLSIGIQAVLFLYNLRRCEISIFDIGGIVAVFYDTISYWTFSHRDLVYLVMLTLYGINVKSVLIAIFYLKMSKSGHFEDKRAELGIDKYLNFISFNVIVLLYCIVHCYKRRERIIDCFKVGLPLLIENNVEKISCISNIFSLTSVYFNNTEHVLLWMIYYTNTKKNDKSRQVWMKYFISTFIPHVYNFNYLVTNIDWNLPFVFTDKINYVYIAIGLFTYFILPQILINNKFRSDIKIDNHKNMCILQYLMLLSSIGAVVMYGGVVWARFFLDRFIFTTLFMIVDLLGLHVNYHRNGNIYRK